MIYFFTPYDFDKRMYNAWNQYMSMIDTNDWAVMMDGDTLLFDADFGHKVQGYIDRYPDTGLFTAWASRSGTSYMMPEKRLAGVTNMMLHKDYAERLWKAHGYGVQEMNKKVIGHFLCMQKKTWLQIRTDVAKRTENHKIFSVDCEISRAVLAAGLKIRLMKGIYVLHYYRLKEGVSRKKQLR